MRFIIVFAMLLAAGVGAAGSAPAAPSSDAQQGIGPDLPVEGAIANPDWLRRPSGDDVADSYPKLASFLGVAGEVTLDCAVSVDGAMHDCKVLTELPTGLGFGSAALGMAPRFAMRPRTVNGAPVGGAIVRIPIRYLQPEQDAIPAAGPAPQPLSEHLQVLTARIAKALHYEDRYTAQFEKALSDPAADPAKEKLALDAVKAAMVDKGFWLAQLQRDLSASFNEQQLAELAAFFESPTGRAWSERGSKMGEAESKSIADQWPAVIADARARFCGQVACVATARVASPAR